MGTIGDISEEHGVTVSTAITAPWKSASIFAKAFQSDAAEAFTDAGMAANVFKVTSNAAIAGVEATAKGYVTSILTALASPWKTMIGEGSPIATFSTKTEGAINGALTDAQSKATAMTSSLKQPWTDATGAVNTFSTTATTALNNLVTKANEAATAISKAYAAAYADYSTDKTPPPKTNNPGSSNPPSTTNSSGYNNGKLTTAQVKTLQTYLGVTADGKWGKNSQNAASKLWNVTSADDAQRIYTGIHKKWDSYEDASDAGYSNIRTAAEFNRANNDDLKKYGTYQKYLDAMYLKYVYRKGGGGGKFAKGTLGTKNDQWGITDEPQFGDELVLIPTAQGNLSYMRKGTSVIPADLTKELMAIGEFGLEGLMNAPKLDSGVNLMNYVSKPELNITFDSMVHVDHCDEGTLKSLEKMVDIKIDQFSKQMNYALARYK